MTLEIKQYLLTNNDCYKAGKKITPKGVMVHSTGANNPKLSRYVQPDDGIVGKNQNANDWNRGGLDRCVHAFIGKDKDGKARIYQTLPWNHRGWHGGGSSNNTHIGFEICEDGLNDAAYFNEVYTLAVELTAYLCKMFNLSADTAIGHYEGYQKGIASNHADPKHWFSRHGKSMDSLREDVKIKMTTPPPSNAVIKKVENSEYVGKKLTVKTDGLWWYNTPRWDICDGTSGKGHTFFVVEELMVNGIRMLKCADGKYRTADPQHVSIDPPPLDWPYSVHVENITHKEAQEIVNLLQTKYKLANVYGAPK